MPPAPAPLRRIGTQTDILGESPVWCTRERALYWVDIRLPALRRWSSEDERTTSWPMPGLVGSLALCDEPRLLVALPDALALFDPVRGGFETLAIPERHTPELRFNDGKCDRQGRFWVGTMNNLTRGPEGVLYRLDRDARLTAVVGEVRIPNSLAWSPDGRTLYFADSPTHEILAYDFDPDGGRLSGRRVFARTTPPAVPDGATVDSEGCLWSAEYDGWRLTRYTPDGRVDRVIELPVQRPTSCAFGGRDLDILFVTTASQRLTPPELAQQPLAGALLALEAGVRGLPEPRYHRLR